MLEGLQADGSTLLARSALAGFALVVLPLCLPLTGRQHREPQAPAVEPAPTAVVLAAATSLAFALVIPAGRLAALLTVPWLVVSAWLAAWGARRFLTRSHFRLEETAIDVALFHLPVGAAWALVYRADIAVLGFAGTQALLTANHFHVAGFGACLLVGLVGRALPTGARLRRFVWRISAAVTMSGILTLALGITYSRSLERIAAIALAGAVAIVGLLLVSFVRTNQPFAVRALFAISGLSGAFAMHEAARFAAVGFAALDGDSFARMLLAHGIVNVVGFVLCGVIAFRLART